MAKKIIITIDGWRSCGKSTLAKQLAAGLFSLINSASITVSAISFITSVGVFFHAYLSKRNVPQYALLLGSDT